MHDLKIQPSTSALVLIDLQQGVVGNPNLAPRSAAEVVRNSAQLASAFARSAPPWCWIAEGHTFAIKHIFPRIGRVRSTAQVIAGLASS